MSCGQRTAPAPVARPTATVSPGTYCVAVDGVNVCALDCWAGDTVCRLSEGYACNELDDVGGAAQYVCVPGP